MIVPLAVMLEPRGIHRTRVHRLEPGPAQRGGGQQEQNSQHPGTAEEPDHRGLSYVGRVCHESGRRLAIRF
jgi:hypothetical protein